MPLSIRGEITGLKETLDSLARLRRTVRNKILRKALTAATTPLMRTVRKLAARESGLLKKSIGRVVRTYRSSGTVIVVLGPRLGFRQEVSIRPDKVFRESGGRTIKIHRPRPDQLRVIRDPVKYAHLVEYGTKKRAAKPFLRPAWAAHKAQMTDTVRVVVADALAALP